MVILANEKEILSKIPSFTEDKLIEKLKTVKDSMKLGQFLMFDLMISRGVSHPNLGHKPGSKLFKYPKFLAHELSLFDHGGLYILEN